MNGKLTLCGARVSLLFFSHRSRNEKLPRADGFPTDAKKEKAWPQPVGLLPKRIS
jgi:hypothetical protein